MQKGGQRTRFWISIKLATTGEPKKHFFLKFCEFSDSLPADSSPSKVQSSPDCVLYLMKT